MVAANLAVVGALAGPAAVAAGGPCDPPVNKIACENASHVNDETDQWQVQAFDDSIVGFTDDISYVPGNAVKFKVKTDATSYQLNIYRLGYYHGKGGRLMQSIPRSGPVNQNPCLDTDPTGLVDCGNWNTTFTWNVPSDATSGLYYAVLHREYTDGSIGESEIVFVVRDDASHSDIVFQTSDATWQAYNTYGNRVQDPKGQSLYSGAGPGNGGSSYKVSYNRPLLGGNNENFIFNAEYPMLKFMESNGYDMSYTTDVDTARRGNLITNHKVFMPVGHDEYWSNEQRNSVEAARAAGVNMAFMTANEVFWKTRWEPSTDATHTNWRTVVCYKETKEGQVDPNSTTWTGTWRDPRQSPPKDGGRPENALLGNIFTVNGVRDDQLTVPSAYGKMWLWRNAGIDNLPAGNVKTFRPGTLGYEWNSVEDNGFQPAGVAQLSKTTVAMTGGTDNYVLQNYGDLYTPGTKTHALTMYKFQPSGALVFGAGTVQWSWGLENEHLHADGNPTADRAMQQATVNLMADMDNVQPRTLRTDLGLLAAVMSSDTSAPAASLGATPSPVVGTPYTFSGTVTDVLPGRVAGVEASVDGGATWHPATWTAGTTTWNYTFTPSNSGQRTLSVRAVDDSANLSAPVSHTVTVTPRQCPCSIWSSTSVPVTSSANDSTALELGVKFRASSDGYIRGVKFYKGAGNTGTHTGSLWSTNGTLLATGTFTGETASGWQTLTFPTSVAVTADTTYIASYHTATGHYAGDGGYFTNAATGLEPLTANQSTAADPNGMYKVGASGMPDRSFGDSNYWVDVVYGFDPGPDTRAPLIVGTNPITNGGSIALNAAPVISFDEAIAPSSLQFTASGPSGAVAGTATLSADGKTATFTPSQAWAAGTTYTMSVRGSDAAGNSIASPPYTWSFKTGNPRPAACPCTVWDDFATPATPTSDDPSAVEVGTKVRFDAPGSVLGVRFYKGAGNTGTHTGSLWSSTGTRLATGTFSGESGGGWQTLTFASPVTVQPGTTYVVSYYAPNGNYSVSGGYFNGVGADYGALHALASGVDGTNGVYKYAAGGGFPTSSYGNSNYWVDVIWQGGANGDSTPPSVTSTSPTSGATGVSLTAPVSATLNEPVDLATAQFTLADPGGTKLGGAVTLSADKKTITLTPSARLAAGTTYTASMKIADVNGNVMPTATVWSFTGTATQVCPCSLFSAATVPTVTSENDGGNYEMGVRFTTSANGLITGVKFYKGTGNTGTHVGTLWTNTGVQLATGTFTGETATGWQTMTFASPVAVTAGTTYVASYTVPNGHYAADGGYFTRTAVTSNPLSAPLTGPGSANGVYRVGAGFPEQSYLGGNYWVDVVYTP